MYGSLFLKSVLKHISTFLFSGFIKLSKNIFLKIQKLFLIHRYPFQTFLLIIRCMVCLTSNRCTRYIMILCTYKISIYLWYFKLFWIKNQVLATMLRSKKSGQCQVRNRDNPYVMYLVFYIKKYF